MAPQRQHEVIDIRLQCGSSTFGTSVFVAALDSPFFTIGKDFDLRLSIDTIFTRWQREAAFEDWAKVRRADGIRRSALAEVSRVDSRSFTGFEPDVTFLKDYFANLMSWRDPFAFLIRDNDADLRWIVDLKRNRLVAGRQTGRIARSP